MEIKLNQLYNQIANHLNSMVPVKWDKIYLLGEVEVDKDKQEQLSRAVAIYFIESETENIVDCGYIPDKYDISEDLYDEQMDELFKFVKKLNNCFKDDGQELWERVVFVLDSDGGFDIDFKYDVMNEGDGGYTRREIIWAYETFGYVPDEGNRDKVVLEEYLKNG